MITWVLLAAFMAACAPSEPRQGGIVRKVNIARPSLEANVSSKEFSGIIREAAEVNLAFRVAGPIGEIYVKEGDFVRQGDLVARIEPRDYEIQAEVYQAQYAGIKAEFDRLTELNSRKSVADNDYDKAVAGEKMLRMQLKNAFDQLQDTRLEAPFSGYIQAVKYHKGEMVNTGMTIATLIDVKSYLVEVDLPVSFYIRRDDFFEFSCSQPLISSERYPIELTGYQKKANNSQLFRTTFRLDPKLNPHFAPGMAVNVSITYRNQPDDMLSVPLSAIFRDKDGTFVWKYSPDRSTVHKQAVVIENLSAAGMIRILSGLVETDEIVVSGVGMLYEGQAVEPLGNVAETNVGGLL